MANIARFGVGEGGRARKRAAKVAAREAAFDTETWQHQSDLAQRSYASYAEYLEHQSSKLSQVEHRLHETYEVDLAEFRRRFADCEPLREARNVLCLAARLGTEVRALHDLGFFAVGIDLNPGKDNDCVLKGDFHHLVFPDGTVDAVYCNSLDHVMDLEKLLGEIDRVLRSGGLFVADLLQGFEEGFTPGRFESMIWRNREEFIQEIAQRSGFDVVEVRDLGHHRRDNWAQVVFRKGGPECTSPTTT
ncbi:MAG: class I SAM-dependent methyltransferase [Kiloniellales bacterium]|nr:class I SAM-dependent methyltransferase [Kiloniellales bacterium]